MKLQLSDSSGSSVEAQKGHRQPRIAPAPRPAGNSTRKKIGQIPTLSHEAQRRSLVRVDWDYGTVRKYLIAAGIDTA